MNEWHNEWFLLPNSRTYWNRGFKTEVLKDSELAPPMDTTNLQLHMEKKKASAKDLNTGWRGATAKGKSMSLRWVDETEIQEKPHSSHSDRQSGSISKVWLFSLRNEGFKFHIRPTNSYILHRRDKHCSELLYLKTSGKYSQENHRTTGKGNSIIQGATCSFTW